MTKDERTKIYDWLSKEFKHIDGMIDATGKVELDGLLWKLSAELSEGKINALLADKKS